MPYTTCCICQYQRESVSECVRVIVIADMYVAVYLVQYIIAVTTTAYTPTTTANSYQNRFIT